MPLGRLAKILRGRTGPGRGRVATRHAIPEFAGTDARVVARGVGLEDLQGGVWVAQHAL